MSLDFTLGQPFKPFEQLMGVFPAARFVISICPVLSRSDVYVVTVESIYLKLSMSL